MAMIWMIVTTVVAVFALLQLYQTARAWRRKSLGTAIRNAIVFAVVVAILIGIQCRDDISAWWHSSAESKALARMEDHGAKVFRDDANVAEPSYWEIECPSRSVFLAILPDLTNLERPIRLSISGTKVLDDDLEKLFDSKPESVASLQVCKTQLTDRGLKHIVRLPGLVSLDLGGLAGVTDSGIHDLIPLKDTLTDLNLAGTGVTENCAGDLERLKLQVLRVSEGVFPPEVVERLSAKEVPKTAEAACF